MTSENAETPTTSFADLGLSDTVLAAVSDMGYERPTPVQAASIPEVLAGRDLLAAAQTGTGKTAAFLLPALDRLPHVKRTRGNRLSVGGGPRMLVITPTRELAQQIDDVCSQIAARTKHTAVTVVGGVSYNPQKSALKRGCDVLVATPGRLEDLINQGACMLDEVEVLVLDEADRMLDMGFLPTVRKIVAQTPADRQTLLFSATLDEAAVGSITDLVRDPARVEIAPATSTAETVDQFVLPVSLEAKNGLLAQVLEVFGTGHVIVFCRTKRRADTACRRLSRAGVSAAAIHGDRSQAQRERALRAFRDGKVDVLVATDVLARGIDISDVRYVINFDVPEEPVDYIHRIGRTGRAGEEGWSVTFVTEQDVEEFYDIEALMGKTADLFAPEDLAELDLGESPVYVDPKRVPRDHVAGKKEKKRRRDRVAKKLAAKYGEDGLPAGALRRGAAAAQPRRKGSGRRAEGGEQAPREQRHGARAEGEAVAETPKPSRRKRSGRTRVHAEDAASRGGERTGRNGEARSDRGQRGGERASQGQERGGRGKRQNRDERPRQKADWRNYDVPDDRRGGRGRSQHAAAAASAPRRRTSGRRPGDNGGRR
ncbi:MAG: DEAD/DEAH box helicase [Coriobacteriaceae bacterium]|nr:DEAD/DEAH box helicase [Coriobacteriaceae bacterium]